MTPSKMRAIGPFCPRHHSATTTVGTVIGTAKVRAAARTCFMRARRASIANRYQEFERGTFSMYISGPWDVGEFSRRLSPAMAG